MSWFTCIGEEVKGPFELEELKEIVMNGNLPENCIVWGRGLDEWCLASKWINKANAVVKELKHKQIGQTWHYAVDGESKGPMSRAELLHELRHVRHKDEILVWTKGMKQWADLFDFHDLVDELGLNRRSQPRARAKGNVEIQTDEGGIIAGQVRTISIGGIGIGSLNQSLGMGQAFNVKINAPDLGESFTVKAQVQYMTDNGYAGMKFLSIGSEAKSKITQYINSKKPGVPEEDSSKDAA